MQGYNYWEAGDGRDGVTAFQEQGPFECVCSHGDGWNSTDINCCSVVLLDLSMPVLDGMSLAVVCGSFVDGTA